ncbi:MAG: glycosidase [Bacteroidales bacterium]|nr:glycosidase [Bacteroidales bacterium]
MNTFTKRHKTIFDTYEQLVTQHNPSRSHCNGWYKRFKYPALTRNHIPPGWMYDLNPATNPHLQMRMGVNTVFNAGAMKFGDKYIMIPRIEGYDVKSFFAVAESPNGIDNWRFWDKPIQMPSAPDPETNVYDMRLTHHQDGWIYGLFCAERKDVTKPNDSSAAVASCGIARTHNLLEWERLPDLQSSAAQQRNCVLHPEFVNGKYLIYTRPQSGFIETGESGISAGFTDAMSPAIIQEEVLVDPREYHTVKEVKNGQGPAPLKTEKGWLHLAHGVRRTAAGLRYVLYLFLTDLAEPWKVIRRPGGHFIEPLGSERVGDVSNVIFSNGWIQDKDGTVFIYYASSDTRMHVATTSIERLLDYVMNTPEDPGKTERCVSQRVNLINENLNLS